MGRAVGPEAVLGREVKAGAGSSSRHCSLNPVCTRPSLAHTVWLHSERPHMSWTLYRGQLVVFVGLSVGGGYHEQEGQFRREQIGSRLK